jgi:hypothetical protein
MKFGIVYTSGLDRQTLEPSKHLFTSSQMNDRKTNISTLDYRTYFFMQVKQALRGKLTAPFKKSNF